MNNSQSFLAIVRRLLDSLLSGNLTGKEFVNRYEDVMADELPDEIEQGGLIYKFLDEYLTEFALYVEDPIMRSEHPDYYGDEELLRKAQVLINKLEQKEKNESR